MSAQNFTAGVAFDALRPRVPVDDMALRVEHINGVVGDPLDQQLEAAFRVLELHHAGRSFLTNMADAGLQRFVDREQPRFQCLALGDVKDCTTQQRGRVAVYATLGGNPVHAAIGMCDSELDTEASRLWSIFQCGMDLWKIVDKDNLLQLRERPFGLFWINAK